jgi:hypothetical protein
MSLEAALLEHSAVMRELIAVFNREVVSLTPPQAVVVPADHPAVKAVVKAQKELAEKEAAKKPEAAPIDTPSGEASTPAPATESAKVEAPAVELQPWHEKTAKLYSELATAKPTLDNVRKAVLGINSLLGQPAGREQATALLGRFGAKAVTFKPEMPDKPGLNADQFPAVFEMALEVLAGHLDVTASMEGAA